MNQYLLLLPLLLMLLAWSRRDRTVPVRVRAALIASLGVVTLIGLVQLLVAIPWLPPIFPEMGVLNPSLLGYKNPAALAVLGQIFLLAELVFAAQERGGQESGGQDRPPLHRRLLLGGLLLLELCYLATLHSRTAFVALSAGTLFLVVLLVWRLRWGAPDGQGRLVTRALLVIVVCLALFAGVFTLSPGARSEAALLRPLLMSPTEYLRSDRGTYLLNTAHMACRHPFGVGLGDWQSQYPVFRLFNREMSFDDDFQVRRAHSDYLQLLGEGGWPALALWLLFLALLIGGTARRYLQTGRSELLFRAAQLLTLAAAMATDYLTEMPYHKAQLFFVVFMALAARRPAEIPHTAQRPRRRGAAWARLLLPVLLALMALAQIAYHCSLAGKIHAAAALQRRFFAAVESAQGPVPSSAALGRVMVHAETFVSLPGHTKTFHKTWLILAQSAHHLGNRVAARAATRHSLRLHPHYSAAFLLMSEIEPDPGTARLWREGYEHILNEATHGFARQRP